MFQTKIHATLLGGLVKSSETLAAVGGIVFVSS